MAQEVFAEWRLADASGPFREWLDQGAPSDDAQRDTKLDFIHSRGIAESVCEAFIE
jgi:hypothetical protein